jgi:hypothetical protein
MPNLRKLAPDEVATLERRRGLRLQVAACYDTLLAPFEAGDYVEVTLEACEHRLTVRNRLRRAAERRGCALRMVRTPRDGGYLRFQLVAW